MELRFWILFWFYTWGAITTFSHVRFADTRLYLENNSTITRIPLLVSYRKTSQQFYIYCIFFKKLKTINYMPYNLRNIFSFIPKPSEDIWKCFPFIWILLIGNLKCLVVDLLFTLMSDFEKIICLFLLKNVLYTPIKVSFSTL